MDYQSHRLLQLKQMCRDRGLRVGGTKDEVIIRLMEDDDNRNPPQQQVVYQQMPVQTSQFIHLPSQQDQVSNTIGIFIVLYGFFRIGVAILFTADDIGFDAILAFMLGVGYIAGGIITMKGYRNGVYMTLGVLVVSGGLNLIFHDEWSPLSIGMDGIWPIHWVLMCSGFCMFMTALPIIVGGEMKEGWPGETLIYRGGDMPTTTAVAAPTNVAKPADEKMVIECPHCDKQLKVPSSFSGNARCPGCKEKFSI